MNIFGTVPVVVTAIYFYFIGALESVLDLPDQVAAHWEQIRLVIDKAGAR